MEAGDGVRLERGQHPRHQVDGAVRVEREAGVHGGGEAGLVDEHDERRHGGGLLRGGHERAGPGPHGGTGDGEGPLVGDADGLERDAEGDRAGELELDRGAAAGDRAEERAQRHEGLAVDARVESGARGRGWGRRARASRRRGPRRRGCPRRPGRSSARMPDRLGSDGAAGSFGWRSSTNVAAARGSVWGRLPIELAKPTRRSTGFMLRRPP